MKTTMTERDKKLLLWMFIGVIIVAIGYWGIRPQLKKYTELGKKIEKQEDQKKLNQMKIMNLSGVEIQAEEYEKKIAEKKDEFYQIMTSSDIDRMMTEIAVDNSLYIYDLRFTMPQSPSERMAYQYSELYQQQMAQKAEYQTGLAADGTTVVGNEDSDKESDSSGAATTDSSMILMDAFGDEEGGYQPNTDIYAVPVTMTVGGELSDLENFIDRLIHMDKRCMLVSYTWGEYRDIVRRDANGNIIRNAVEIAPDTGEEGVSEEELKADNVVRKSLTVRIEIYMCDTSDIVTEPADSGIEESADEVTE
ncbi:MAG: hypothetical protein IJ065_08210 [Eubacterium sp.]|nr:hypothetical protein [Eubacterium sp.]